eukprot:2017991-Rhodomonas_salina.5
MQTDRLADRQNDMQRGGVARRNALGLGWVEACSKGRLRKIGLEHISGGRVSGRHTGPVPVDNAAEENGVDQPPLPPLDARGNHRHSPGRAERIDSLPPVPDRAFEHELYQGERKQCSTVW